MAKGKISFGAHVSCGKCTSYTLVSNLFNSGETLIMDLLKDGWTLTKKYGWVCSVCNYQEKKRKDEMKKKKRMKLKGDHPF